MNHSFNVEVARMTNVLAATVFNSIGFWVENARANERNFHDGRYWTYNSVKAWSEQFPYATDKQIASALGKLRDAGLIEVGNYSENKYDRTLWYTLSELGESFFIGKTIEENQISEEVSSILQNGEMDEPSMENLYTNANPVCNPHVNPNRRRFVPPTEDEVSEYMRARGTPIDSDSFCAYYESVGWMRGKTKMRDWKAAARGWYNRQVKWDAEKRVSGVKWDEELEEYAGEFDF